MRILFVAADLHGYGGIQLFGKLALQAICEEFGSNSFIHVISRMDTELQIQNGGFNGSTYAAGGNYIKFAKEIVKNLYFCKWDIVIFMHINLTRILPFCPKVRSIVTLHGIECWTKLNILHKIGLKKITSVIYISNHTKNKAIKYNHWLNHFRSSICYLGIQIHDIKTDNLSPLNCPYILSIGRMQCAERYKGFDELIAIWPKIQNTHPDLKLVLMGDGPDRIRLEALVKENHANVIFTGRVQDNIREQYLKHCKAFVLPSRGEGFGLVYLEAMRYSKPIIAGNTDAGAEVVIDRISGRTVNPLDAKSLHEALLDVIDSNAVNYGDEAFKRFNNIFTYDHFKLRFSNEIKKTLSI